MFLPSYPGHGSKFGYSVQTWIAKVVNEYLHPGSYFCWFAMSFNAMRNGDSANPIWIYLILDRAVAQGDGNNAKLKDVRANLLHVVDRELRLAGRSSEIATALYTISHAPLNVFTPQLWCIDMSTIAGRYTNGYQYPDEYCITNLNENEFKIIIP